MKIEAYSKKHGPAALEAVDSIIINVASGIEFKSFVIEELGGGRIKMNLGGYGAEVLLEAALGRVVVLPHRDDCVAIRREKL